MARCPICSLDSSLHVQASQSADPTTYDCTRCGKFSITGTAEATKTTSQIGPKLSAWIRERNQYGIEVPKINSVLVKDLEKSLPDYNPTEKQLILLRSLEKKSAYPGHRVKLCPAYDYPLAWAACEEEFVYYIRSLTERGLLKHFSERGLDTSDIPVEITAAGWDYLDEHARPSVLSDQTFVAMSFSPEMKPVWEQAMQPAIIKAGFKPYRIDAEPHVERIDAKIITEIKNSRFLVAEVTEQKHGVYFEAGFALGLGIPVIWCVRKDDLKNVHFDTRQYNHVLWESPEQLKDDLYYFICAVIGARRKT